MAMARTLLFTLMPACAGVLFAFALAIETRVRSTPRLRPK